MKFSISFMQLNRNEISSETLIRKTHRQATILPSNLNNCSTYIILPEKRNDDGSSLSLLLQRFVRCYLRSRASRGFPFAARSGKEAQRRDFSTSRPSGRTSFRHPWISVAGHKRSKSKILFRIRVISGYIMHESRSNRKRYFHGCCCCCSIATDFWSQLPTREHSISVCFSFPPRWLYPADPCLRFVLPPSAISDRQQTADARDVWRAGIPSTSLIRPCHGRIIQSTVFSHDDRISLSRNGHVYISRFCASVDPFQFHSLSNSPEDWRVWKVRLSLIIGKSLSRLPRTRYDLYRRFPLGTWLQIPDAIDRKLWHNALRVRVTRRI